jgi:hypothetical protein
MAATFLTYGSDVQRCVHPAVNSASPISAAARSRFVDDPLL